MTEALRVYTITVCSLVILIGTPQLWRRIRTFMPENQFIWLAFMAGNLAFLTGTISALVLDLPGGFRVSVTAAAVTFGLLAVCYRPARWIRLHWWRLGRKDHP